MSGERENPTPALPASGPLDTALRALTRKRMARDQRTSQRKAHHAARVASPTMSPLQTLEPRLLMAGDVVYALNAGGPGFTDTNGITWVADTPFTNSTQALSFTASTSSAIDRNHPSVPSGTSQQLLQTERYDAPEGAELAYALGVPNGTYQVDLYFADTYSGTQGVGKRVFDIQLEGNTVADDYDIYADAGRGYKAVVQSFTVAVDDGVIDLEFLHEVENPALKAILVRTAEQTSIVGPELDLNGPAAGNDAAATFTVGDDTTVIVPPDATLTDVDSDNLVSLTASIFNRSDNPGERLEVRGLVAGVTAQWSPASSTLVVEGLASVSVYENILRNLSYTNDDPAPDLTPRVITVTASDGTRSANIREVSVTLEQPTPDPVAPVLDLNGSAAGTGSAATFVAGDGPVLIAGLDATVTDVDSATLASVTVTLTNPLDGSAETLSSDLANVPSISQSYANGVLTLSGVASVADYNTALALVSYNNTAATPDTTTRLLQVVANDGALDSNVAVASVAVQIPAPDPVGPVLDLNGSDLGTEYSAFPVAGEGPVLIATPDAILTDTDSATLASLTATLDITPDGNDESLDADVTGTGITKFYSNGVLTLSGVASVADYQAVLRTITYNNAADPADTSTRFLTVVANDGVLDSNPAVAVIVVSNPVVDPPVPAGTVVYALNAAGESFTDANGVTWVTDAGFSNESTAVSSEAGTTNNINLTDDSVPDGTDQRVFQTERWDSIDGDPLSYALAVDNGEYQVELYFAETFVGTQGVGKRVFDVLLENNLVLDDLDIFDEVGGYTGLVKTFTVNVTDGTLDLEFLHEIENPAIKGIVVRTTGDVTPDPIAPVLDLNGPAAGTGSAATLVAGDGPVLVVEPDATLIDTDSATLASLAVTLVNSPDGVAETLDADVSGTGITKSYSNGVLSLTGVASVADYQAVLRTVTYDNLADPADTTTRVLTFVANDAALSSDVATATVNVSNPAPDPIAPVIDLNGPTNPGNDLTRGFDMGGGPVVISFAGLTTITDADSDTLESLQVQLFDRPDGAAEILDADVSGTPISKSYADGLLTLSGIATVAEYEAVLETVTYDNTSAVPDDSQRLISFFAFDGDVAGPSVFTRLNIRTFPVPAVIDLNGDAAGLNTAAEYLTGGSTGVTLAPNAVITDADSTTIDRLSVRFTNRPDGSNEFLSADAGDTGLSVNFLDNLGILDIAGRGGSIADYQAVLRSVSYTNNADPADTTPRTLTVQSNDGFRDSNLAEIILEVENPVVTPGEVVYALNAGGPGFTDANGVTWVNDTPFSNTTAAEAFTYSNTQTLDLSDPSLPANTAVQLFQTERWDSDGGSELSYALDLDNGDYQVDLYFAEIFGGTNSVGARVFDVQLEGATVLDDYDAVADVGGFTGVVKTFNVSVTDGQLDIDLLREVENPAIKGILVRTLGDTTPDPVAPVLDLNGPAAGTNAVATFEANGGPINIAAANAALSDTDSATLASLSVFLVDTPDGASERLDADVTGTGIAKAFAGGVLSLTGVASVADYQAVLRTVTYDNLAAAPDLATRSINAVANDGTLDSNTAIATITVVDDTVQPQPGSLVADVSTLDFNNAQVGVVERLTVTLTHPGAAIDDPVVITGTNFTGISAADFGDLFTQQYGESVTVNPGESIELVFYALPGTTGAKFANVQILHSGTNALSFALEANGVEQVSPSFGTGFIDGLDAVTPTTLQWGPDNRLYVGTLDGLIHAYTIERLAANAYSVTDTQTITLVQDIPNHEDDGTLNPSVDTRLITGIKVVGTADAPVIYVTSSDPRLTNGDSSTIDTNSGIVSKLTLNASDEWEKIDLIRGLPRSAVDHAPHALQLLEDSNTLLVAVGGLTNAGGPGAFFGNLPEYALSAAIISLDLDTLEALPTLTDANGQQYKYNLPTLDDEDRPGINDANDPFGGNAGDNQAVLEENGPVDIFAAGLRNPYDFVVTQFGEIYSTDNGPNASIGSTPILDPNGQPTNQPSPGGVSASDALHRITQGSYSGHPNPTRANTDNTFNDTNPQSPIYDGYTEPGTYTANGQDDALALFDTSTNGITEYTATGFDGALNGDLLTVTIDGKLTRLKLSPDGTTVIDREILFNDAGTYPLDLTTVGDDHPFAGTIWVADLFAGPGEAVRVFEPDTGTTNGTPNDLDGDGYSNQDEIDNGTNPESSGDTPTDNDRDFLSDLNDADDDNDETADLNDPFQVDPTNGNNTNAPFTLSFDNDDLNRGGLLDLGFTGVMTNGSTDYLDQFDFANLTAGSAAGVLTIDAVGPGTALGDTNTQENAFQFGLNLNPTSQPVTIQTKIDSVFDNTTPVAGQRAGIYFGTGDQDNYIAVFVEGDGTINTVTEIDGQFTYGTADIIGQDNFTNLNLYLTVDPATQTVQAAYSFGTGPIVELLGTTTFPLSWLQAPTAPAVGVIATSGDSGEAYSVTYDFIRVEPAAGSDGQAPFNGTPNQVDQRVEAENFDLGGNGVAYLDLSAFNEGNANPRPGEFVDLEPTGDAGGGINVGWIEAGEWLEYTFDIETAGTYSADFRVALDSGTGSTFHLEINGQNISGPINLPVTGGWQTWQTITVDDLQLNAGPVVLRVAFDSASVSRFAGNFNWLQLNSEDGNSGNDDGLDLGDSNEFNWVDAPPIPGGDRFEAMTFTANNLVYVFGGFADGLSDKFNDVWVYNIATNQWAARAAMPTTINHLNAKYDEATGLAWFVGGFKGEFPGQATDETWIYDVANDTWTQGPDLPAERSAGQAAIVGRTLHYISGYPDRANDASTEHYVLDLDNPEAGWSTKTVAVPVKRGHGSVAVIDTDIYLIGGTVGHDNNTTDLSDVYRFDTLTDTWTQVADLPFGWSHAEPGTFSANGRIFIGGGRNNADGRPAIDDFYMYDPDVDAWIQLPDLPRTLLGTVVTVVDDPNEGGACPGPQCGCASCQALFVTTGVFNGLNGTSEAWAADFDNVWHSLPGMPNDLGEIAAGVIDNTLYVVGDGDNGTYAYDFTTGQWRNENRDRPVPAKDQLAEVIDGKLYVMGGISYSGGRQTFNDLQIYDPATKTWTTGTDLPENIFAAQTTVIDGKIYLTGGVTNANQTTDHTYVYDPADGNGGSWTQLADAPLLRNSAAVGTDGEMMFIFGGRVGGDSPGNGFTSVMIYDPATDTWETSEDPGSTLAELPQARGGIVNAPFIDGEFYVIGGETDDDPAANDVGLFDRVDIYDPLANTWREGAPMLTARHGIYPVAHAGAVYIPGGGVERGASNSNVFDVYYPNLI